MTLTAPCPAPADAGPELLAAFRKNLSSGRASLGEMFGGHWEDCAHGATVRTVAGEDFLNCAGYGVFLLGNTHPHVTEAVVAQVRRNPLATRLLLEPVSARAASAIAALCPPGLEKVHFTGSGAEATESAIKLARLHGKRRLITMVNGYHGKTMGALSVTAREVYQESFRPLLPDVVQVPYGDAEALEAVLREGPDSCVIVEPVQGEGGVIFPPEGYLAEVRRLCTEHGALFVADEILTGLGRLGRMWGIGEDPAHCPDILLIGKGLSGGVVPVAAAVARPEIYRPLDKDPFLHTSTFAASPLATAAALAACEALVADRAVERAARIGSVLLAGVNAAVARIGHLVREVRGEGLLIGVELADPGIAGELMLELIDRHLLVNHSMNNSQVLRLTPPAVLSEDGQQRVLAAFDGACTALARRFPARSAESRTA